MNSISVLSHLIRKVGIYRGKFVFNIQTIFLLHLFHEMGQYESTRLSYFFFNTFYLIIIFYFFREKDSTAWVSCKELGWYCMSIVYNDILVIVFFPNINNYYFYIQAAQANMESYVFQMLVVVTITCARYWPLMGLKQKMSLRYALLLLFTVEVF